MGEGIGALHRVRLRSRIRAATRPVRVEELAACLVGALVGMCAEVVALCLQQIRRQLCGSITVEIGERRAQARQRNAELYAGHDHSTPSRLTALDRVLEEWIEQQVH